MGRPKKDCWSHVTKVKNGSKDKDNWICNYCKDEFSGGASRINAHLTGNGGGIRKCSKYPANDEGVNNNMASTSSNPPQPVTNTIHEVDEGPLEVIATQISNLVNHQNNLEMMNLSEGVNGNGCNTSVCESEIPLKQLVLDLDFEENDIANQLQCLESRGKKRKSEVDDWLKGLQDIKKSTVRCMNNLNDTHRVSELIQKMKRHKEEKPLTLSTEYVGGELDENIKRVLKLLDDDKFFVIGIYGMGGIGKTLLATLVENEVKRKTTFKDVFWVTVSDITNISKLQHDIAKRIGVKLDEDDERIRAYHLSSALEKKEKSVLILDDVWRYIDLEKVGIIPKVNGIKVIVTSRLEHVCHQMDCQPYAIIQVDPLSCHTEDEYESENSDEDEVDQDLELFKLKLGHDGTPKTLPHEIEKIARCIVERFHGLPLAISVMARTMKGIDDIHQWKHALNQLKKFEMGPMVEEVFKVLKRSYDNLMDKDLQNCFLSFALLSIDGFDGKIIDKEELIMKLVDNGQINKNMCLEEIFDEGNTILNMLEAHSLISSEYFGLYTHPLVRSMACYIMKESQRNVIVKLNNERFTKIPLSFGCATHLEFVHIRNCVIEEISEDLSPNCPKLSILIINYGFISHVPESFFKYMNSLSILDLSFNKSLVSLPNSITNLRSLVSLILKGCDSLKHVPPLGELQALSRLVISKTSIEEAPQGLEKLNNLKWLDLSENERLDLELGSFSSYLTKLQYLDLRNTRAVIKVEDVQRMKILECFRGAIDCNQFMQNNLDMSFGLIKTYHLILGNVCGKSEWKSCSNLTRGDFKNRCIEFQDCDRFSRHILPKDHTLLRIYKNNHWVWLCDVLSYSTSSSVRTIQISYCDKLESLFCLSGSCSFCTKIHKLEILSLSQLKSLTVICKDVVDVGQSLSPVGIFSCLKEINISFCNLIEKLLTPQLVQQLHNLEEITVSDCNSMKEIFAVSNNDDNDNSIITLPKLTRLELKDLPELKIVCKGIIHCESLPDVDIGFCPWLDKRSTMERFEIPY
ncbi:probable disease resistance protein At5g43730 isoform X6 [Trifolium pratense]|nr:probable disease resistance protein At5g43730 isoform X6 [Trifolium pratense]XP_045794653.1 probable disease resistance protein At5g43730 isoform X6 [Trifolium pratense]XP_045794654.1 probable disease resistance protein At5g43730 isoform X6 [Trifolium pratense]